MVQLEPEMAERVRALAKQDKRTLSNFVGVLIEKHLGPGEAVLEPQATYGAARIGVEEAALPEAKKTRSAGASDFASGRAGRRTSLKGPAAKR